jgi:hypothetical protein
MISAPGLRNVPVFAERAYNRQTFIDLAPINKRPASSMSLMGQTRRLQSVVRTTAFSSVSGHCEWLQRTAVIGRIQPLASNQADGPIRVKLRHARWLSRTSAPGGTAVVISVKADISLSQSSDECALAVIAGRLISMLGGEPSSRGLFGHLFKRASTGRVMVRA